MDQGNPPRRQRMPWDIVPPTAPLPLPPGLPPLPIPTTPTLRAITIPGAARPPLTFQQITQAAQPPVPPRPPFFGPPSGVANTNPLASLGRDLLSYAGQNLAQQAGVVPSAYQKGVQAALTKDQVNQTLEAMGLKAVPLTDQEKIEKSLAASNARRALEGLPPLQETVAAQQAKAAQAQDDKATAKTAAAAKAERASLVSPQSYYDPSLDGITAWVEQHPHIWPHVTPDDIAAIWQANQGTANDPAQAFWPAVRAALVDADTAQASAHGHDQPQWVDATGRAAVPIPPGEYADQAWSRVPEAMGAHPDTTPPDPLAGGLSPEEIRAQTFTTQPMDTPIPPPSPYTDLNQGIEAGAETALVAGAGAASAKLLSGGRISPKAGALVGLGVGAEIAFGQTPLLEELQRAVNAGTLTAIPAELAGSALKPGAGGRSAILGFAAGAGLEALSNVLPGGNILRSAVDFAQSKAQPAFDWFQTNVAMIPEGLRDEFLRLNAPELFNKDAFYQMHVQTAQRFGWPAPDPATVEAMRQDDLAASFPGGMPPDLDGNIVGDYQKLREYETATRGAQNPMKTALEDLSNPAWLLAFRGAMGAAEAVGAAREGRAATVAAGVLGARGEEPPPAESTGPVAGPQPPMPPTEGVTPTATTLVHPLTGAPLTEGEQATLNTMLRDRTNPRRAAQVTTLLRSFGVTDPAQIAAFLKEDNSLFAPKVAPTVETVPPPAGETVAPALSDEARYQGLVAKVEAGQGLEPNEQAFFDQELARRYTPPAPTEAVPPVTEPPVVEPPPTEPAPTAAVSASDPMADLAAMQTQELARQAAAPPPVAAPPEPAPVVAPAVLGRVLTGPETAQRILAQGRVKVQQGSKPIATATNRSVRDLPVAVSTDGTNIRVHLKVGNQIAETFTFPLSEWFAAQHRYGNVEAGLNELLTEKLHVHDDPEFSAQRTRQADAARLAIREMLQKANVSASVGGPSLTAAQDFTRPLAPPSTAGVAPEMETLAPNLQPRPPAVSPVAEIPAEAPTLAAVRDLEGQLQRLNARYQGLDVTSPASPGYAEQETLRPQIGAVADQLTAARHTAIDEAVAGGMSLPEARELVRKPPPDDVQFSPIEKQFRQPIAEGTLLRHLTPEERAALPLKNDAQALVKNPYVELVRSSSDEALQNAIPMMEDKQKTLIAIVAEMQKKIDKGELTRKLVRGKWAPTKFGELFQTRKGDLTEVGNGLRDIREELAKRQDPNYEVPSVLLPKEAPLPSSLAERYSQEAYELRKLQDKGGPGGWSSYTDAERAKVAAPPSWLPKGLPQKALDLETQLAKAMREELQPSEGYNLLRAAQELVRKVLDAMGHTGTGRYRDQPTWSPSFRGRTGEAQVAWGEALDKATQTLAAVTSTTGPAKELAALREPQTFRVGQETLATEGYTPREQELRSKLQGIFQRYDPSNYPSMPGSPLPSVENVLKDWLTEIDPARAVIVDQVRDKVSHLDIIKATSAKAIQQILGTSTEDYLWAIQQWRRLLTPDLLGSVVATPRRVAGRVSFKLPKGSIAWEEGKPLYFDEEGNPVTNPAEIAMAEREPSPSPQPYQMVWRGSHVEKVMKDIAKATPGQGAQVSGIAVAGIPQQPGESDDDYHKRLQWGMLLASAGFLKNGESLVGEAGSGRPFFSQLAKTIAEKMPNKASVEQLRGLLRSSPVKEAELRWTGLDEQLSAWEKAGVRPTKAQVQEWLDTHRVDVHEVVKGEESLPAARTAIAQVLAKHAPQLLGSAPYSDEVRYALTQGVGEHEASRLVDAYNAAAVGQPKFSQYTLPGGEPGTYRELLLTMPIERAFAEPKPYPEWLQEQPWHVSGRLGNTPRAQELYSEYVQRNAVGKDVPSYKSGHWDEPNILAHLRFSEHTAADGTRVLLLDEAQSDFAQAGRKKGFTSPEEQGRLPQLRVQLNGLEEDRLLANRLNDHDRVAQLGTEMDRVGAMIERIEAAVPSMPFPKTEQWTRLGMVRFLRWAVDHGFDAVAWTTGEQQEERYWGHTLVRPAVQRWEEVTRPQSIGELGHNVLGREMATTMPLEQFDGGVLAVLHHDQVRQAVVAALPVDVVSIFRREHLSPNDLFNQPDVVATRLPINERHTVALGVLSAQRQVQAHLRAELSRLTPGGADRELLPTLSASDLSPREIAGLLDPIRLFHDGASGRPETLATAGPRTEVLSREISGVLRSKQGATELAGFLNAHTEIIHGRAGLLQQGFEPPPGEGMRSYYDEILPNVVNGLAKKFGGRASTAEIDLGPARDFPRIYEGPAYTADTLRALPGGHFTSRGATAREEVLGLMRQGSSFEAAMSFVHDDDLARNLGGRLSPMPRNLQNAHSLAIPDALKASLLEGVSVYSGFPIGEGLKAIRANMGKAILGGSILVTVEEALRRHAQEQATGQPASAFSDNPTINTIATLGLAGVQPRDYVEGLGIYGSNVVDPLAETAFEILDLAPAGLAALLGSKVDPAHRGFFDTSMPTAFVGDALAGNNIDQIIANLKARAKERQQIAPAVYFAASLPFDPLNWFGWSEAPLTVHAMESALHPGEAAVGHAITSLSKGAVADRRAEEMGMRFHALAGTRDAKPVDVLDALDRKVKRGVELTPNEAKLVGVLGSYPEVRSKDVLQLARTLGRGDITDPPPELVSAIGARVKGKRVWTDADVAWLHQQFDAYGPTTQAMRTQANTWLARSRTALTPAAVKELMGTLGQTKVPATIGPTLLGKVQNEIRQAGQAGFTDTQISHLRLLFGSAQQVSPFVSKASLDAWAAAHGVPDLSDAALRAERTPSFDEYQRYVVQTARSLIPDEKAVARGWLEGYPVGQSILAMYDRSATLRGGLGVAQKAIGLPLSLLYLASPSWVLHAGQEIGLRAFHPSMALSGALAVPRAVGRTVQGVRQRLGWRQIVASLPPWADLDQVPETYGAYYMPSTIFGRHGMGRIGGQNPITQSWLPPLIGGRFNQEAADIVRAGAMGFPKDSLRARLIEGGATGLQNAHVGKIYDIAQSGVGSIDMKARQAFIAREHPKVFAQIVRYLGADAERAQSALAKITTRPPGIGDAVWRRLRPLAESAAQQGRMADLAENVLRGKIDQLGMAMAVYEEEAIPVSAQSELWAILHGASPEETKIYFSPNGPVDRLVDDALEFEHGDRVGELVRNITSRADLETAAGRRAAWAQIKDGLSAGIELHRDLWDWAWQLSHTMTAGEKDLLFAKVRETRQALMSAEQADEMRARQLFIGSRFTAKNIPFPKDVLDQWNLIWEDRRAAFADTDARWAEYWAQVRKTGKHDRAQLNALRDANTKTWNTYRAQRLDDEERITARLEDFYSRRRALPKKGEIVMVTPEPAKVVPDAVRTEAHAAVDRIRQQLADYTARPTVDAKQAGLVRAWAQQVDQRVATLPEASRNAIEEAHQATGRVVSEQISKRFVDYTDRTNLDEFMHAFVPFWMYDWHGGAFYSWLMTHVPGASESAVRYLDQTQGTGYYDTQGSGLDAFGTAVSPIRGLWPSRLVTFANKVATYRPQSVQGILRDVLDQGLVGSHLTPLVSIPARIAAGENLGQLDEPPIARMADDARAFAGYGVGRTDQFTDYATRQELAARGVNPDTASERDRQLAQARVGQRDFLQTLVPRFTYKTPEQLAMRSDFKDELAKAGISKARQQQATAEGISPWALLNARQKQDIFARHPGWHYILQASEAFDPPDLKAKKVAVGTYIEKLNTVRTEQQTRQTVVDDRLTSGAITNTQWMKQHHDLTTEMYGKRSGVGLASEGAKILADAESARQLLPEDAALAQYYTTQATAYDTDTDPSTGLTDYAKVDATMQGFLASLPPEQQQYIKENVEGRWSPTEKAYHTALTQMNEYDALPRFQGMTAKDEADRKAQELERAKGLDKAARLVGTDAYKEASRYVHVYEATHPLLHRKAVTSQARLDYIVTHYDPQNHADMFSWFGHPTLKKLDVIERESLRKKIDASGDVIPDPIQVPWSLTPPSAP